ncbi:MAG: aminomethyltransferase family protein [Proteobacteria bacterium]|nr:aminomethyltransferase family protein [Pseudomonadota bacterium]MBU1389203.1 aminomethyltransferase family protein [Pseudomonadota bacterium]MBU1543427.1 aminomethyltransferase family protein [Pseudomonadota bacterium]MBU2429115.1 aminomethyltransferase family protein [Pseudomonadota bacterium]MBU2480238.1 aminomethyltransferase family protein [Pseudomonadota bacterium]
MTLELKTTPMHAWHKAHHANMSDFAGFDMPLWYETGIKKEHFAVLQSAGIFDTSHMSCIRVSGPDAFNLLNYCFTRQLSALLPGQCTYGAFLDTNGFCIDDAVIYKFDPTLFMVCVNAGMGAIITDHLKHHSAKTTANVSVTYLSSKIAKIDIQGPASARILSHLIADSESIFAKFPYFSFKGYMDSLFSQESLFKSNSVKLMDHTHILLSRSGYTGEFGFEIFLPSETAFSFWENIIQTGKEFDAIACGLGARDSLRTGACLPLSHQDIGVFKFIRHPWESALPFNSDKTGFTKSFSGDLALLNTDTDVFYTYPFIGNSLKKTGTGNQSQVLDQNSQVIGAVLTCATDMAIDWLDQKIVSINTPDLPCGYQIKGLSCGFIKVSKKLAPGTPVTLTDGKRTINVTITTKIRPDTSARKKINRFI